MEVNLTKPVSVRTGDTVVITCGLRRGQSLAKLAVWSAVKGYEMSPHVFNHQLVGMEFNDGRPLFVRPLSFWLRENNRQRKIEFVADENLDFIVVQNVDLKGDPVAKAKVKRYGKVAAQIRRLFRNAIGALRGTAESGIRV
jgi:hypothetical protein